MTFSRSTVGISVVAAAIIMTGCGSSSSNGGSGDSTPESLTQEVTVTTDTGTAVMSLLPHITSPGGLADMKAAIKAKAAALKDTYNGTDEGTYDCDISGTYSYKYVYKETEDSDGSYTDEDNYSYSYDHCVDNASYGYSEGTYNLVTYNGTYNYSYSEKYDAATDKTTTTYKGEDNYSYTYEDNSTGWSTPRVYKTTYTNTETEVDSAPYDWTDEYKVSGYYSRQYLDENGTAYDGYKYEYNNLSGVAYGDEDNEHITMNGSSVRYDINETGEHMDYGFYYKDLVSVNSESGNEMNATVNGTFGTSCLGGAVKIATTQTVQMNSVDYVDGCAAGSGVLPYAGVVTITGDGTATATSDTNGTTTWTTISSGDTNVTYNCWDEVYAAAPECSSMLP